MNENEIEAEVHRLKYVSDRDFRGWLVRHLLTTREIITEMGDTMTDVDNAIQEENATIGSVASDIEAAFATYQQNLANGEDTTKEVTAITSGITTLKSFDTAAKSALGTSTQAALSTAQPTAGTVAAAAAAPAPAPDPAASSSSSGSSGSNGDDDSGGTSQGAAGSDSGGNSADAAAAGGAGSNLT